ncbi:unnamed protein product, partial [Closterium sp. NIES-54]
MLAGGAHPTATITGTIGSSAQGPFPLLPSPLAPLVSTSRKIIRRYKWLQVALIYSDDCWDGWMDGMDGTIDSTFNPSPPSSPLLMSPPSHLNQPELIRRYKWQQVALIYSDDRFGRNGVTALALQLLSIHAEADVAARVAIPLSATDKAIHQHMSALKSLDVAVYVLHTSPIIVSAVVAA